MYEDIKKAWHMLWCLVLVKPLNNRRDCNLSYPSDGSGKDGDGEAGVVDEGHERVVRREMGARVEDWSERRRGKRRLETVVVAPQVNAPSRKMPKGGTKVQWTAVARDMYVEQQRRYERGEGGGVT